MEYLLLIYDDEDTWGRMSEDDRNRLLHEYGAFGEWLEQQGIAASGNALQPTATATTVALRGGERLVSDGPFAETKEQLAGYYLVDCQTLDDAIDVASRIPSAKLGRIEVRPVMVFE